MNRLHHMVTLRIRAVLGSRCTRLTGASMVDASRRGIDVRVPACPTKWVVALGYLNINDAKTRIRQLSTSSEK